MAAFRAWTKRHGGRSGPAKGAPISGSNFMADGRNMGRRTPFPPIGGAVAPAGSRLGSCTATHTPPMVRHRSCARALLAIHDQLYASRPAPTVRSRAAGHPRPALRRPHPSFVVVQHQPVADAQAKLLGKSAGDL